MPGVNLRTQRKRWMRNRKLRYEVHSSMGFDIITQLRYLLHYEFIQIYFDASTENYYFELR